MPLPPLLRKFLPGKGRAISPLTPREKANILITALAEATTDCLTQQAHLIGYDRKSRHSALNDLAQSFATGNWVPDGLTGQDMRLVGEGMITDIVHRIANGYGISGYEVKIHELFQSATLPEVRPSGDGHRPARNQRRAYYRV